jgi:hypothetical protein
MKETYTTVSIKNETKTNLQKVMILMGKKMTWGEIIEQLVNDFLEEERFVQSMINGDMIGDEYEGL